MKLKGTSIVMSVLFGLALMLAGCAHQAGDGWITLIDGEKGLDNWNRIGDANWRAEGGAIVADIGKGGFLVSKHTYKDFEIRAEFWAESSTNSGIFIRCADPAKITAANCYEVNIWDTRPELKYATGAIVDYAAVPVPIIYKAAGKWSTFEIKEDEDRPEEGRGQERSGGGATPGERVLGTTVIRGSRICRPVHRQVQRESRAALAAVHRFPEPRGR